MTKILPNFNDDVDVWNFSNLLDKDQPVDNEQIINIPDGMYAGIGKHKDGSEFG